MGGDIVEYLAAIILILIFATGYVKTIKKIAAPCSMDAAISRTLG